MLSFSPSIEIIKRILKISKTNLEEDAYERWEIHPENKHFIPSAVFLPDQLERMRGTEFASAAEIATSFHGGYEVLEAATLGFRIRNVDFVDGVLYSRHSTKHLRQRIRFCPAYRAPSDSISGALYESWLGNRWFGNWLADDCLTYRLAEQYGEPVCTTVTPTGHVPRYESLLDMKPRRVVSTHFHELTLFDDHSTNAGKMARAAELRDRIIGASAPSKHAGVFLLRGVTGDRRVLLNERALAERLSATRGFRILDPSTGSVEAIADACAGARVVAGVEGSHLTHGFMLMPPGAALLVLQPPQRVVAQLKVFTDRRDQIYAFVIGEGGSAEFSVNINEVEKTLDLIDSKS
jgi:hypothetical protein